MRRVGARLAALVLVCVFAAKFDAGSLRRGLQRAAGKDPGPPASFAFDPSYRSFLRDVRALTPPDALIRVEAPKSELLILQASYQLAPRRVIPAGVPGEVDWVAVYRRSGTGPGRPISGGLLRRAR